MRSAIATGLAFASTELRGPEAAGGAGMLGTFVFNPGLRIASGVELAGIALGLVAESGAGVRVAGLINEEKASASALLMASSSEACSLDSFLSEAGAKSRDVSRDASTICASVTADAGAAPLPSQKALVECVNSTSTYP